MKDLEYVISKIEAYQKIAASLRSRGRERDALKVLQFVVSLKLLIDPQENVVSMVNRK